MKDIAEHRGFQALAVGMLVICAGALALVIWLSDRHEEASWDTVAIGARCGEHGAEERTFDGSPVYCAKFASERLLVWSPSERDIPAVPEWWLREALTAPPELRSQVRMCMWSTENSDRACQAAIEWSEQEHPPTGPET